MKLIDADALNPMRCPRSIAEMRKWIDEQPTISQWIPVSERLPKEYEDVLVTLVCNENGGYICVAIDCIAYDGKWFAHYNDSVVAWMPLPEPYKESDNDAKD